MLLLVLLFCQGMGKTRGHMLLSFGWVNPWETSMLLFLAVAFIQCNTNSYQFKEWILCFPSGCYSCGVWSASLVAGKLWVRLQPQCSFHFHLESQEKNRDSRFLTMLWGCKGTQVSWYDMALRTASDSASSISQPSLFPSWIMPFKHRSPVTCSLRCAKRKPSKAGVHRRHRLKKKELHNSRHLDGSKRNLQA